MKVGNRAYDYWVNPKIKDATNYKIKIKKERKLFEHLMLEARLIYKLKPKWNCHFKNK